MHIWIYLWKDRKLNFQKQDMLAENKTLLL